MAIRKTQQDIDNDPEKVGTRYTVRNPHPDFTKDDNIINEYGHTKYPKWIDHPTKKEKHTTTTYLKNGETRLNEVDTDFPEKVLVNSEEEEKALMASAKPKPTPPVAKEDHKIDKSWNK